MFITLKRPTSPSDTMEQVAFRGASSGRYQSRVRSCRRPACISCQAKKLRCTGRSGDCNRCRARSITCVFPASQPKGNNPRVPAQEGTRRNIVNNSVENGSHTTFETSDAEKDPKSQEAHLLVSALGNNELRDAELFDDVELNFENEVLNLSRNANELDLDNSSLNDDAMIGLMDSSANEFSEDFSDAFGSIDLQTDLNMQNSLQELPPFSMDELAAIASLKGPISLNESSEPPAQVIGDTPNSDTPKNASSLDPSPSSGHDSGIWSSTDCSCVNDAIRMVQQLDEDSFRITSLSLDQVLQLQKWQMSQCSKSLECANCSFLPTLHTLLVIICDRLVEMFECTHKRITKANQLLSGQGDTGSQGSPSNVSKSAPELGGSEQLYCASSGVPAGKANCNPNLFSSEFQNMYSGEEQVHMIRVLLKLQIRNFRGLLVQVDSVSRVAGSEARRSKIKSMVVRLGRAAMDIDIALRVCLKYFAAG